MITLSQILILVAVIIFGLYVFVARSILTERLAYLALAAIGIVLSINPELSTAIARRLGIGQGVNLMFYLFILFSLFFFVNASSAIRHSQRQITTLTRQMAIEHARHGPLPDSRLPETLPSDGHIPNDNIGKRPEPAQPSKEAST